MNFGFFKKFLYNEKIINTLDNDALIQPMFLDEYKKFCKDSNSYEPTDEFFIAICNNWAHVEIEKIKEAFAYILKSTNDFSEFLRKPPLSLTDNPAKTDQKCSTIKIQERMVSIVVHDDKCCKGTAT